MRLKAWTLLMVALFISSCVGGAKPGIQIQEPWITEAKISSISAEDLNKSCICDVQSGATQTNAHMTIHNNTGAVDRLLKAESDAVVRIEFRRNVPGGGDLSLAPVDTIEIPASGQVDFAPGGYAMILMGIKKDLIPGDKMTISLFFEKAGQMDVTVEIRAR